MFCYIKSFKDFSTMAKYEVVDYTFADGQDGRITVYDGDLSRINRKYVGCWAIIYDGSYDPEEVEYSMTDTFDLSKDAQYVDITGNSLRVYTKTLPSGAIEYNIRSFKTLNYKHTVYYISAAKPLDDLIEMTIVHPIYAFDRPVYYIQGTSGDLNWDTYGNFIYNTLTNEFGSTADGFGLSYMRVVNNDNTQCRITSNRFGYVTPSAAFEQARNDGIDIDFSMGSNEELLVTINPPEEDVGVIVFGDGHSILSHEQYDPNYYSKVTVLKELQNPTDVIAVSEEIYPEHAAATFHVELCIDTVNTQITQRYCLKARLKFSWGTGGSDEVDYSEFENRASLDVRIRLSDGTDGRRLLTTEELHWSRTNEAGSVCTDWFDMIDFAKYNISDYDHLGLMLHVTACVCGVQVMNDGKTIIIPSEDLSSYSYETLMQVFTLIDPSHIISGEFKDGTEVLFQREDYYLKSNGTIVQTKPSDLVDGKWGVFEAQSTENPLYVAQQIFNSNGEGHKIEFYSDKFFKYRQKLRLRIRGDVFDTFVVSRSTSKSDRRYHYTCGLLLSTLTDHVKQLETKVNGG